MGCRIANDKRCETFKLLKSAKWHSKLTSCFKTQRYMKCVRLSVRACVCVRLSVCVRVCACVRVYVCLTVYVKVNPLNIENGLLIILYQTQMLPASYIVESED